MDSSFDALFSPEMSREERLVRAQEEMWTLTEEVHQLLFESTLLMKEINELGQLILRLKG